MAANTNDQGAGGQPFWVRHRRALRAAAVGLLGLTAAGVVAGGAMAALPHPEPRDSNGNLSNAITSTSAGANCVTGTEPGCSTVLATPIVDPRVGGVVAGAAGIAGLSVVSVRRRRTVIDWA